MKERGVGKPWTKDEDELLTQAVLRHGENDNWKTIALFVPERTNKACRKRWLHSLSPSIRKTAWTHDEDQKLLSLFAKHGAKWSTIARGIPGRTDDACSKRYREALNPSLKRGEWTTDEDRILLDVYGRIGGKWRQVGNELNRSGLACRNRWRMLERKKAPTSQRTDQSMALDAHYPGDSTGQAMVAPPAWELTIPYADTQYWDADSPSYASPTELLQDDVTVQYQSLSSTAYISPDYSPPPDLPDLPEPGPFQYTSSSLSAALSLAAVSPCSTHVGSPIASRLAMGPAVNHTQLSNTDQSPASPVSVLASESQQQIIPQTHIYQPPSPTSSSSPDLSALGSQDLSLPIPFDDSQGASPPVHDDSIIPEPQQLSAATPFYPTPGPSPILDESVPIAAEQDQASEQNTSHYYRTTVEKNKAAIGKVATSKRAPRHLTRAGPPRLSALLPASDHVLAYVCGNESCWPHGQAMSSKCYSTSQELYDHWKVHHSEDTCERPYRCGLPDCGKGWKSINGLQYHLQLSKAHFQKAISATISHQPEAPAVDATIPTVGAKKMFGCPHPGCANQYKQMSGLRYHLNHGHSQQLPHQLNYVPPALARKVADKLHPRAAQEASPA